MLLVYGSVAEDMEDVEPESWGSQKEKTNERTRYSRSGVLFPANNPSGEIDGTTAFIIGKEQHDDNGRLNYQRTIGGNCDRNGCEKCEQDKCDDVENPKSASNAQQCERL